MAITVPPVRGAGDLGHVDDSNVVRQALLDLDAADTAHAASKGDVHGFRWDETVGRRLFAWDAVNGREQMIYGDTGWRDVSAGVLAPFTLSVAVLVRRVGALVSWTGEVRASGTLDPNVVYPWIDIPAGFRFSKTGGSGSEADWPVIDSTSGSRLGFLWARGTSASLYMRGGIAGTGTTWPLSSLSYMTSDPWPTALPGDSSGPIPTGLVMDTAELLPAGAE